MTSGLKITRLIVSLLIFLPTNVHAFGDPFKKIAKDLGRKIQNQENPTVALLAFPYHDGKVSSGSSIISERLTTMMVDQKGMRIIERNLIIKLLEEKHLSETGVIDQDVARKLGEVLGVDILVTGTLIDLDSTNTEINARGLLASSGEIVAASRVVIKRSWHDAPRFPPVQRVQEPDREEEIEKPDILEGAIEIGIPVDKPFRRPSRGYFRRAR